MTLSPDSLAAQVSEPRRHRATAGDLDVAVIGVSEPGSPVRAYAEAGATWWLEHLHGYRGSVERLVQRVKGGPPREAPAVRARHLGVCGSIKQRRRAM